jgi:hypothetical protein
LIGDIKIFAGIFGKSLGLHGYFGWMVAFFNFELIKLRKRAKEASSFRNDLNVKAGNKTLYCLSYNLQC